jgi:hypothetical protein
MLTLKRVRPIQRTTPGKTQRNAAETTHRKASKDPGTMQVGSGTTVLPYSRVCTQEWPTRTQTLNTLEEPTDKSSDEDGHHTNTKETPVPWVEASTFSHKDTVTQA